MTSEEEAHEARKKEFSTEVGELIERYWDIIGPFADPDIDAFELAEVQGAGLAGWVLLVEARSLEEWASSMVGRFTPPHQSVLHSLGMMEDSAAALKG